MTTLLLRADATPATGMGHLGRCLALAQAARQSGWRVHGAGRASLAGMRERAEARLDAWHELSATHPAPADLEETLAVQEALRADWIVLDGYAFDTAYQSALRARARLLALDDGPRLAVYDVDLLLDQNLGAEARRYPLRHGRALLGREYLLLRPEFLAARVTPAVMAQRPRLLVSLGGVVESAALEAVLAGLNLLEWELEITVLTGAVPGALEQARSLARGVHRWNLLAWHDDMPDLMANSDLAISAAGSTAWELASLGVPSLLVALADHQTGIAAALDAAGAGIALGGVDGELPQRIAATLHELLAAAPRRADMAARARRLVDGQGARRVLEAMTCR